MNLTRKRVYVFSNQWKWEREFWITPSISFNFSDGLCLDISFLIFKFYTFNDYNYDGE